MCDQQSLRSACAYPQSDQRRCSSLEYFVSGKLLTEHRLEFLSFKVGCTRSSKSTLAKMPHCWKSHFAAQLCKTLYQTLQNITGKNRFIVIAVLSIISFSMILNSMMNCETYFIKTLYIVTYWKMNHYKKVVWIFIGIKSFLNISFCYKAAEFYHFI